MTLDVIGRCRRFLVLAAVPLAALAVAPRSYDPVAVPKLALAWAVAVLSAVASVVIWRATRVGRGTDLSALAVGSFVAGGVVSGLVAENLGVALLGRSGRGEGLLLYLAAALLFCAAKPALADEGTSAKLLRVLAYTGGLLAVYGLLQRAGLDPLGFQSVYSPVIATMGNPNFLSGYAACAVPASFAVVLDTRQSSKARVLAGLAGVGAGLAAILTGSQQGPIAAVVGVVVVLGAWRGLLRRRAVQVAVGVTMAAMLMVLAAVRVSILNVFISSLQTRIWYWEAAGEMFADHPVVGVGMAAYGDYFRSYRPLQATLERLGAGAVADAPHSVPIGMFAQGGLVLGLAYLFFIGVTAYAAVQLWRRPEGNRAVGAGLVGVWVAYVLQSLVSFDLPSHVIVHWLFAAAIVGRAGLPRLGRASDASPTSTRTKRPRHVPARDVLAGLLVAAVLIGPIFLPVRANAAAGRAVREMRTGDGNAALRAWDEAVAAASWDPALWADRGRFLVQAKRLPEAYASYQEALERNSRNVAYLVTAGRLAAATGHPDEADRFYQRALQLDPTGPEILVDAARFLLEKGEPGRARAHAERAVELVPHRVDWWLLVAEIRAADGDLAAANAALDSAEQISPGHSDVTRVREELQGD